MDMDAVVVVTGSSDRHRWRRKGSISGHHAVAQLLESPLPTPRRSCSGRRSADDDDDTPAPARRGCAAAADASPLRGLVPFEWESSPGVPKSAAAAAGGHGDKAGRDVMPPPKPPPGRCVSCPAAPAHHHHSNATDSTSSDQQDDDGGGGDDDDTFSGAMERVSSSDRLAALSARLSAIDGAVFGSSRRCRSPSFIMDRFLPAANAIATTSADKPHPRRRPSSPSPRSSSKSKSKRDREAEAEAAARARFRFLTHIRRRALAIDFERPKLRPPPPPHCHREHAAARPQAQLPEAPGEKTRRTPKACGLMFFVPWSAKPVLLGFHRSPARSRTTPRGDVASVLEKDDGKLRDGGGLSYWHDERSGSGKWAMAALLGTSKRYCADARKALSRLTRSGMDIGGDSPRIGTGMERSGSKHKKAVSDCMLRSTSVKMPPLSPPSESWLSNARRSNAGSNKS